jgi:Ca2+-binding EF-hand superfamily protein
MFEWQCAQEFEAFAMAQSKLLRKVFDDLDADKSGTIDVEEVRGSLQRLGMKYDDGAVTKLIKRIDVDGNGKIDFNEWQVTNTDSRPPPSTD